MATPSTGGMSHFDYSAWSAVLANGEVVRINDYVYLAPPWSQRDGSPYSIARIIEFVPPSAARQNGDSKRPRSREKHARVALFYRPSEISGRAAADHRLLYAAIHSEVHPLSWLRGKCYVRHRDKIESLQEWKKRPDHFHFLKLFDPFIKREYEMLRTETVRNIPADIKHVLASRFEFLVTEKEMVADLTDSFRTCYTCKQWASSQDSVRCEVCKYYYHMGCVNPPLLAKPAKGYSWVCQPCGHGAGPEPAPTGIKAAAVAKLTGKGKDREASPQYDKPDAFYRGWNFRYFGQYTVAEDTLDPDDPIFPRNATRLGPRFQCVVPAWDEQEKGDRTLKTFAIDPTHPEADQEFVFERGTDRQGPDGTLELMSKPEEEAGDFLNAVRALPNLPKPDYDVELIDKALHLRLTKGPVEALRIMSEITLAELRPLIKLSPKELQIFENEIARVGSLEHHDIAKRINRRPADIVRYYYNWRNGKLAKEHEATKAAKRAARAERKKMQKQQLANQRDKKNHIAMGASANVAARDASPDSDAEGSVYAADDAEAAKGNLPAPSCSVCSNKYSKIWWKAPRSLTGNFLCESCGTSYRKYGIAIPNKYAIDETLRRKQVAATSDLNANGKRDGTPAAGPASKRGKASGQGSAAATPPPTIAPPQPPAPPPKPQPCVLCRRADNKSMARCKNCSFSIHAGCYGIPKADVTPDWLCDPCANETSLEAMINPTCVLCPKKLLVPTKTNKRHGLHDFNFLHAIKPTEGYRWAHVLCALFQPDVSYNDALRLKVAEGIMNMNPTRWTDSCQICKQEGGAVIECADCKKTVHASCAWLSNYKFGLELVLASALNRKKGTADNIAVIDFGGEQRAIIPQCWCPGHAIADERIVLDLQDIEPSNGDTAMQMYAVTYKGADIRGTFRLLRKAQRLEKLLPPAAIKASSDSPQPELACQKCSTHVSPKWYEIRSRVKSEADSAVAADPAEDALTGWLCHQCHFTTPPASPEPMET